VARDPTGLAEATAQLFCGVRLQCAKCHNHPFERWTQDDYYGIGRVLRPRPHQARPGAARGQGALPSAEIVYATAPAR